MRTAILLAIVLIEQYCQLARESMGDLTSQKTELLQALDVVKIMGSSVDSWQVSPSSNSLLLPVGYRATFHDNDQLERLYHHNRDGALSGFYLVFYDNGQLSSISHHKYGLIHGPSQTWYSNGSLSFLGHFEDGLKVGTHKHYTPSNQLDRRVEYKWGDKVEEEKFFYNSDKRAFLEHYVNGKKHGEQIH